jgi:Fic family protein
VSTAMKPGRQKLVKEDHYVRISLTKAKLYSLIRLCIQPPIDHQEHFTMYSYKDNNYPMPRLDPRLARRLETKKARLDSYRPLSSAVADRLQESLRLLLTYHSNAIEGNTLTLRETQIVLETGITIGGHPLREHLEATNHAHAYEYLITLADGEARITGETILDLHRLVMSGIDDTAGHFRTGPVYIRGARMTPPPASHVERLIEAWLSWLEDPGRDYAPIVRAAIAHHDFEAIHTFFDGNGRTGRLLMNLMLMQEGYPPALLLRDWRGNYLRALDSAGAGSFNPLANLTGRAVEGGLDLYLQACERAPEPEDEYVPLAELARHTEHSADYLGWLVRRGRLEATKRGGRWYSTHAALERYKTEVESGTAPRGRPPKKAKS